MNMKKSIYAVLLAATMTLAASGCDGKETAASNAGVVGTVAALGAETQPDIATAPEAEAQEGEPDARADIYYVGSEDSPVLTSPPSITLCSENGELATACLCVPQGYSWSYPDGELMASAIADTMAPSQMFGHDEIPSLAYSDTLGTVTARLPANAAIADVSRWTTEQSFSAEYSEKTITLANDGSAYVYQIVVEYPEKTNPNGFGRVNYCFIVK